MRAAILALLLLFGATEANAACSLPFSFSDNTLAFSAQINADFSALKTCIDTGSGGILTSGHLYVGNASNVPADTAISGAGDCTASLASTGVITFTCTKTSGTVFGALATLGVGAGLISSGGNAAIGTGLVTDAMLASVFLKINPALGNATATSLISSGLIQTTGAEGSQFEIKTAGLTDFKMAVGATGWYVNDTTNSKTPFIVAPNTTNSLTVGTTTNAFVGPITGTSTFNKWTFTAPTTGATLTAGADNVTYTGPAASKTLMASDYSNGSTLGAANALLTSNGTGIPNAVALTGLVLGNGAGAPTAFAPTSNALLTGAGAAAPNAVAITGLVKGNGAGAPAAYGGASCTNQFPRSLDLNGAATCATVASTDLAASLSLTTPVLGVATGTSLATTGSMATGVAISSIIRLFIQGATADTTTYALYAQDSAAALLFSVRDDGQIAGPKITTGTNADFMCLTSSGVFTLQGSACTISSMRFKNLIGDYKGGGALATVAKLEPIVFTMKPMEEPNRDPNYGRPQIGLSAENVAAIEPRCAIYEDDMKTPKSWRQECMIAVLVAAVQAQQREIEALKARP